MNIINLFINESGYNEWKHDCVISVIDIVIEDLDLTTVSYSAMTKATWMAILDGWLQRVWFWLRRLAPKKKVISQC